MFATHIVFLKKCIDFLSCEGTGVILGTLRFTRMVMAMDYALTWYLSFCIICYCTY